MSCLHELFPGLEAALIRDVYDNVNKDTPKAIEELLILQVCLPACLPNPSSCACSLCASFHSMCSELKARRKLTSGKKL